MRSDGRGLHRVPTGDLAGVVEPDWGSAPRDAGTGAAAVATSQRTLAQVGSTTSAARRCAARPEPHPTGPCGAQAVLGKRAGP
jgi:hypothetical protein